jgi:hypothetical protein
MWILDATIVWYMRALDKIDARKLGEQKGGRPRLLGSRRPVMPLEEANELLRKMETAKFVAATER